MALFLAFGGSIAALVLALNVVGRVFHQSFAGHLIGLLWLAVGSALLFARLVYLGLAKVDEEGSPETADDR